MIVALAVMSDGSKAARFIDVEALPFSQVWQNTPRSGAARLLVNGGHDNDGGGLGHRLENELLTPPWANAHQ